MRTNLLRITLEISFPNVFDLKKLKTFLIDIKSPLVKMELQEITIFKHNNQNVDTTLFTDIYNSPKKIDNILDYKIKQEQFFEK
jgi:hypothetical protein